MIVEPLGDAGVLLLKPRVFRDARGQFLETWHDDRYAALGLPRHFVQDNVSKSGKGVLRGLHFQHPDSQGKLVTVLAGSVFDVAVDVRRGSRTFGRWVGHELTAADGHQLWVPPGFAHGFLVTGDEAVFSYKCTAYYAPQHERSLLWNDPAIGIQWPDLEPVLSEKDAAAPRLAEMASDILPTL